MRGGPRHKKEFTKGSQALLDAIWKSKGGITKTASLLGTHSQTLINWRNRGKVPLVECPEVSKKLGIYLWGLNYEDLAKFNEGKKVPHWLMVVKAYGLMPEMVRFIMSLEKPNT